MKKNRTTLFCLGSILLLLILDQMTKENLHWFKPLSNSVISFDSFANLGFILGNSGNLTIELIIATQVLVLSFLVPLYIFFINYLPKECYNIYFSTSLIISGCIGNVIDKVRFGFVRDWIRIQYFEASLNLADLCIITGIIFSLVLCFKNREKIFYSSRRKVFLIMPRYQLKVYAYVAATIMFSAILFLIVSYFFLVFVVLELDSYSLYKVTPFFILLAKLVFIIVLNLLLMSSFMVSKLTHRSAGPIYAFRRFITLLNEGQSPELKLRKNDNFKVLEDVASQISKYKND